MRWSYELHTGSATWAHRTGCSAGGLLVGWAMTIAEIVILAVIVFAAIACIDRNIGGRL